MPNVMYTNHSAKCIRFKMFDETSIRIDWHKENAALKYVHLNVFFSLRQYLNGRLIATGNIHIFNSI